jgi:hypothetical protein
MSSAKISSIVAVASTPGTALRQVVAEARSRLEAFTDAAAVLPRAPGKWSRKQIIGHLIDSASVNHERFVRAQFTQDLICPPYDQDAWVAAQQYHAASWTELIALFTQLNLHLANVMETCPIEIRRTPRVHHNLDQVAFSCPSGKEAVTL